MIRYLSASEIHPVSSPAIKNGVLAITPSGTILEILTPQEAQSKSISNIEYFEGILVPGFINTHCHLELSHLKNKIVQKTGIVGFVKEIIKQRQSADEQIIEAMQQADSLMYENGIVAVGDISNQIISKKTKLNSLIHYHTFVETMGFNPTKASEIMQQAIKTQEVFLPLPTSIVPHAPYSVSEKLFEYIKQQTNNSILSIHNQESEAENNFFKFKKGTFLDLYQFLGLIIDFFNPSGKSSLQTYLPQIDNQQKTLLVHNTFTNQEDIDFAIKNHKHLYWCLCPNANLYIENTLPNVTLLKQKKLNITLGTDSLASNHTLCILSEMKTLSQNFEIDFEELLKWATLNGAIFLGLENRIGSFEIGKQPGVNLISNKKLDAQTSLKKII